MAKKARKPVTEQQVEAKLMKSIERWRSMEHRNASVDTYEERGVLTRNRGLVITLASGEEFQITIVKSR